MTVGQTRNAVKTGLLLLLTFVCELDRVHGQDITKKSLDHDAYGLWNTVSREKLSEDGHWIMYTVQNGAIDGESTTHFLHCENGKRYSVPRATGSIFTHDSRFAIYRITPPKKSPTGDQTSQKPDKPELQYLELSSGKIQTVADVKTFSTASDNGEWLACLLENNSGTSELKVLKEKRETYQVTRQGLEQKAAPLKLKSRESLAKERGEGAGAETSQNSETKSVAKSPEKTEDSKDDSGNSKKKRPDGTPLLLIDLNTGIQRAFPNVLECKFSEKGNYLAFITVARQQPASSDQKKAKKNEDHNESLSEGVHLLNLNTFKQTTLLSGLGRYKGLTFSNGETQLAFLTKKDDDAAETDGWSIYLRATKGSSTKKIASEGVSGIPQQWWISPDTSLRFSDDDKRLYFDTAPIPDQTIKQRKGAGGNNEVNIAKESKKANLDLWHWKDPQLQPQQLLRAETERKRDYRAAYVMKSKKVVQLANRHIPTVDIDFRSNANIAVANTNMPYRRTLSWDYPGFQDIYLVNLDTGVRQRVSEKVKWTAAMSPEGKYIVWFDAEKKQWFAQATQSAKAKPIQISRGIKHPLQNELHDTPNLARAYGSGGWLPRDEGLLIYDRYDLWQLDPTGQQPATCLTNGIGRKESLRFRATRLDPEQIAIEPTKPMVLSAFHTKTKASGYFELDLNAKSEKESQRNIKQLIMLDESVTGLKKAKQSDRVVFTRSTFQMCGDLWTSTVNFDEITRVSDINPQQDDYSWGTAELVHWKASDGQKLDGILMKPDNFDASKKYPMMVYFYERNSDNLHRYYTPAAGRSIICHSFYVSRGYLVFIPDIPYKTGQPGPSAVNAILPGVDHLVEQGFVRESKIGIQGHSWGGYQTAYLVTQTDRFACAESGAPVSNMTSAYGGIRWGSGLSRMFQYERTQSRIGEDLWSARDKYVSNSPLFYADQINTPLLILHNDQDGAVPWYQGIELFVALRRLGRPAWMLNYNGEPHWVMDDYNRLDFAKRMQQFFDHYLQDAPEPEWMAVGIPAVKKGVSYGLELLEPEKQPAQ